jgi:hypothetical protein
VELEREESIKDIRPLISNIIIHDEDEIVFHSYGQRYSLTDKLEDLQCSHSTGKPMLLASA